MFTADPVQQPHINPVGNLPPNIQATCRKYNILRLFGNIPQFPQLF